MSKTNYLDHKATLKKNSEDALVKAKKIEEGQLSTKKFVNVIKDKMQKTIHIDKLEDNKSKGWVEGII